MPLQHLEKAEVRVTFTFTLLSQLQNQLLNHMAYNSSRQGDIESEVTDRND
jgi:hypothetical protein